MKDYQEKIMWSKKPDIWCYIITYVMYTLLIPMCFIGIPLLIYAMLDHYNRLYTITNKRIICRTGIFTITEKEILLKDIVNINLINMNKFMNVGTVQLCSAGSIDTGLNLSNIRNPKEIRDSIRKLKDMVDKYNSEN